MAAATTMAAAALSGCASTAHMTSAERDDCPGQIVCPLTGQLVCIDQCPVRDGGADGTGANADVALAVAQPGSCCAAAE